MKISFIGGGNIASAIIGGITKDLIKKSDITVYDISRDVYKKYKEEGFNSVETLEDSFVSDIIFLTIKPQFYPEVLEKMGSITKKIIVTVAPGITVDTVKGYLDKSCQVIRTMPNTPLMVGEGMTVMVPAPGVHEEKFNFVKSLFEKSGKVAIIKEELIDATIAVASSSPAYIYMLIETLADGGVYNGLSRDDALTLAAQAVLGSAKMVLETGIHPAKLKDMVCSPNGTTIRAVKELEDNNFRGAILSAMNKCFERAKEMQKGK
ncbi:MAG: pyrroline-5-carboxylate reductase [Ruminococcaceae bacterium]|nr:pyrroline-5-carboxylate reductase [Oscillospiraceae bacterium]